MEGLFLRREVPAGARVKQARRLSERAEIQPGVGQLTSEAADEEMIKRSGGHRAIGGWGGQIANLSRCRHREGAGPVRVVSPVFPLQRMELERALK